MSQLDEMALNWLLDAEDPGVRYLALRDLLDKAGGRSRADRRPGGRPPRRPHRGGPGGDAARRILGTARPRLQPQVPLHRLGADPAGAVGRAGRMRRAHRPRLPLRAGPQPDRAGPVHRYRRAFRHDRLPAGQPDLGAERDGQRRTRAWTWPSTGWRAPSPARGSRPRRTKTPPSAITPTSAARGLPAASTNSCPAPGGPPK